MNTPTTPPANIGNDITDDTGNCPRCQANWQGSEIPVEHREEHYGGATHFSRLIGMEDRDIYDGCHSWKCPDCEGIFPRLIDKHAKWKLKMLDSGATEAFFWGKAPPLTNR